MDPSLKSMMDLGRISFEGEDTQCRRGYVPLMTALLAHSMFEPQRQRSIPVAAFYLRYITRGSPGYAGSGPCLAAGHGGAYRSSLPCIPST